MKNIFCLIALCLVSTSAFAESTSEYLMSGAVVIEGDAAMNLYADLKAKEKVVMTVTRQQNREKQTRTVKCEATFLGGLVQDSETEVWSLENARCVVRVPISEITALE